MTRSVAGCVVNTERGGMPIIDLTHTLSDGMAQYPGDAAPPRVVRRMTFAEGGHFVSALDFTCHLGTHLDTPLHFLDGQPGLEAMPLEKFRGRGCVIDAPAGEIPPEVVAGVDLGPVDYLILRTGWERHWGTPRYYRDWPWLSPALARTLAGAGLKGVGLDSPSIDPLDARICHDLFAAAGMINVENLANLAALPAGLFDFLVLPLKLAGTEASPVRAVALI